MNKHNRFITSTAFSTLFSCLVLSSATTYADDTEVFFGGSAIGSSIKPNVLFVLDNSGSMAWSTTSESAPSNAAESRINILKKSFSDLITNAKNINAGVMVLNARSEYNNKKMVYPITDIDSLLPNTNATATTPEIIESGDDATQISSTGNLAVINGNTLLMGKSEILSTSTTTYSLDDLGAFVNVAGTACRLNTNGLTRGNSGKCKNFPNTYELNISSDPALMLFTGINVPASSTITSATLIITPITTSTTKTLSIQLEESKTPAGLNDNSTKINTRALSSSVDSTPALTAGTKTSIDISDQLKVIQELAPTNDAIQTALIQLSASSSKWWTDTSICMRISSNCKFADLPKLAISYTSASPGTDSYSTALRFQNVGIPQGATITSARLDFVPAAAGKTPVTLQIRAENTGDATVFSNTTDLSARVKTNAVVNWDAPNWTLANPPVHVPGPDVRSLVQEVVSLSSWCGNNSMAFHISPSSGDGLRTAVSLDGSRGLQPALTVTYSGGGSGCLNPIYETRVSQTKNDAWENDDNSHTVTLGSNPLPLDRQLIAARFESLPIVKNAKVMKAEVILTPDSTVSTPSTTLNLALENSDNSAQFTKNSSNLSNRTPTPARSCIINNAGGGWTDGVPYICNPASLKDDIEGIFAKSTWASGNALSLLITPTADSNLDVVSFENSPADTIKLRLKLRWGGLTATTRTVRDEINALVQSIYADSGTPIVPTLDEAVSYYRGNEPEFGAPMTSACQPNHLVLLTDGSANSNTGAAKSSIASFAGTCKTNGIDDGEVCGRELTKWIYDNDLNTTFDGKQNITVHTIGFALDANPDEAPAIKSFLTDLASPKAPNVTPVVKSFYDASNATKLNTAFSNIIQSVMSVDTSFVAPGATVNQFSRKSFKNELYYSLFKPQATDAWPGNLKRYALDNTGTVIDADGLPAVIQTGTNKGSFETTARSFWSATDDGNSTQLGGAAGMLPDHTARNMYTWIGDTISSPVALTSYPLNSTLLTNSQAAAAVGGQAQLTARLASSFAESNTSNQQTLINWMRGSADGTASGTQQRKFIGDPLHSEPVLVTYGCNSYTDGTYSLCASEDQSVFIGNNEGLLQVVNTADGVEQFSFIPESLLRNIKPLKDNLESTSAKPRPYGLDNTVALWVNDLNNNGTIFGGKDPNSTSLLSGLNPGEFVYAYATMGRGGRDIYALDVTTRTSPTLLWQIKGGTTGFTRLGQTWSTPVVTKIKVGTTTRNVLIFAGGYDTAEDTATTRTADSMGNALYIVDAETGALIWSASSAGAGATLSLSNMLYSMPASPRVIDLNGDGLADQIFIGDMGGQLWRFYINNGNSASALVTPADSNNDAVSGTTDGVFANIGGSGATGFRRFYNSPDVALISHNGSTQLSVSMGSGYRGHPLNSDAQDRIYSFRSSQIYNSAAVKPATTITESDLYDATSNLLQTGTTAQKTAALTQLNASKGWMIQLSGSGEKVLSETLSYAGTLYVTTYAPGDTNANLCKAVAGTARLYSVSLTDATAYGSVTDSAASRSMTLSSVGIPPRPIVVHLDGTSKVIVGTETVSAKAFSSTIVPTYWIDQ